MDSIMAEDQGHIFYIIPNGNHYFKKKKSLLSFKNWSTPLMSCDYGVCLYWHEGCFEHCFHVQYNDFLIEFSSWRTYWEDWTGWMYFDQVAFLLFAYLFILK